MSKTKRGPGFWCAGAGVLLLSASALAVDVKGSVRSSEEPKHDVIQAVRAPYFQEWNGFIEPKKKSVDYAREVACVLIGGADYKDDTIAKLADGTLTPSTIVMQVSTNLRVRNEDDFAHQLFAVGLKAFDPVETASGSSRQIQMLETGNFAISDKLAPHIQGHLHVLAKVSYVTAPGSDGSFSFKDVQPGHYTLKIFRGANELSSSEVDLPDDHEFQIDPVAIDGKPGK
jgi:hypothetical protein